MRIIIFCNGRSGSTSLFNFINCVFNKSKINYASFFEPFNYNGLDKTIQIKNITNIETHKNIIIKTFIDEDNYPYESFNNFNEYLDWCFKFFDKIILLERENKMLQAESLVYHLKTIDKNRIISWHKPKYYYLSEEDKQNILEKIEILERDSIRLKEIVDLGYFHITYEDIFIRKDTEKINNLLNYINLSQNDTCYNEWINNPYKKVRIDKEPNSLI